MAAALVPILAPVAAPIIEDLITKLVEKIFPPKSGAQKLPVATEILGAIQTGLAAVSAPGAQPPANGVQLTSTIQASVNKLKAQGQLNGAATVIDPTAIATVTGGAQASDIMAALAVFMKAVGK